MTLFSAPGTSSSVFSLSSDLPSVKEEEHFDHDDDDDHSHPPHAAYSSSMLPPPPPPPKNSLSTPSTAGRTSATLSEETTTTTTWTRQQQQSQHQASCYSKQGRDFYDDGYYNDEHDDDDEEDSIHDRLDFSSVFTGRQLPLHQLQMAYRNMLKASLAMKNIQQEQQQQQQQKRSNTMDHIHTASSSAMSSANPPPRFLNKQTSESILLQQKSHRKLNASAQKQMPAVFVHGVSGTGKSTLIQKFVDSVETETHLWKPFFWQGKYEELAGTDPYSAIVEAISGFCHGLLQEEDDLPRVAQLIHQHVGPDVWMLQALIPELGPVLNHAQHSHQDESNNNNDNAPPENSWNRLKYIFQKFVHAVAQRERPVVLFLDNLQWADNASLNLISSLLGEKDIQYLFFVGAYRTDEVPETHPLHARVQSLQASKTVLTLELDNWTLAETQLFISQALQTTEDVHDLAHVVYAKTRGNVLFVQQMLEELTRLGALYFSRMTFCWEWNLTNMAELEDRLSDNVVEAVVSKIAKLPQNLIDALKVAAYTRSTIDRNTLHKLLVAMHHQKLDMDELIQILDQAVLQGLFNNTMGSADYKFAHDRIQQACYSLVPEGSKRDRFRFQMAHKLLELYDASQKETHHRFSSTVLGSSGGNSSDDWMLFVAVDHFNATSYRMPLDPLFLARVNLRVGEKAASVAAFETASNYLHIAMTYLLQTPEPWTRRYELTLKLYRTIADVELCQGHFDSGFAIGKRVLKRARTQDDRMHTYLAMAVALGREEKHEEALKMNRDALLAMNAYPRRLYLMTITRDLLFAKRYFAKHSNDELLSLPINRDPKLEVRMALLNESSTQAFYCGNTVEFLLGALKMVRLTIKKGLTVYAGLAFVKYGVFCSNIHDHEAATRFGRIAKKAVQITNARKSEPIISFSIAHWIDGWYDPHEEILGVYKNAHKSGMEIGDVEAAFLCSLGAVHHAHGSGFPLTPLELASMDLKEQMHLYNVKAQASMFAQIHLTIQLLTGSQKFDIEELSKFCPSAHGHSEAYRLLFGYLARCEAAVFFGEYAFACRMADAMWRYLPQDTAYVVISLRCFYAGLAYSGLARTSGKKRYLRKARKWAKKLNFLNQSKGLNSFHRHLIMKADILSATSTLKSLSKVRLCFEQAIQASTKAGHIHDAALAHELLAEAFLRLWGSKPEKVDNVDRHGLIRHHLSMARAYYADWGARAKVRQLEGRHADQFDFLLNLPGTVASSADSASSSHTSFQQSLGPHTNNINSSGHHTAGSSGSGNNPSASITHSRQFHSQTTAASQVLSAVTPSHHKTSAKTRRRSSSSDGMDTGSGSGGGVTIRLPSSMDGSRGGGSIDECTEEEENDEDEAGRNNKSGGGEGGDAISVLTDPSMAIRSQVSGRSRNEE